jgi:hypothetical protein
MNENREPKQEQKNATTPTPPPSLSSNAVRELRVAQHLYDHMSTTSTLLDQIAHIRDLTKVGKRSDPESILTSLKAMFGTLRARQQFPRYVQRMCNACSGGPVELSGQFYPSGHAAIGKLAVGLGIDADLSGLAHFIAKKKMHYFDLRDITPQRADVTDFCEAVLARPRLTEEEINRLHALLYIERDRATMQFAPNATAFDGTDDLAQVLLYDTTKRIASLDSKRDFIKKGARFLLEKLIGARGEFIASKKLVPSPSDKADVSHTVEQLPTWLQELIVTDSGPGGGRRLTVQAYIVPTIT